MKKMLFLVMLILVVWPGEAARLTKRPLIELGPKASLYISSVNFGLGAEMVVNPLRSVGLRMDLAELSFGDGGTRFSFNRLALDALIYIPVRGIKPYGFLGFGLSANGATHLTFRGGLGLNYAIARSADIYIEPGVIVDFVDIPDGSRTDATFRLSAGGRFGILK
ncbi:hypothetical protein IBX73_05685 [candidate division WOR-3 bacterium]|nr:hypothetical protein [candidate division WOR-3 bacterium]